MTMKMWAPFVLCCCAVLGFADNALSQGSSYNLLGFGTPLSSRLARLEGLGGAGSALAEPRGLNDLNPAAWTWLNRTRFDLTLRHEVNNAKLEGAATRGANTRFSGFLFGAPIWSDYSMALSLGFAPLTDAQAESEISDSIRTSTLVSEGGITMAYLGLAAQPIPGVAIGAKLDILFGNIRHHGKIAFTGDEPEPGEFQRDYALNGLRPTFGMTLHGDSLLPALARTTLAFTYSPKTSLVSKQRTVVTPISSALDTTIEVKGEGSYPAMITVGASVALTRMDRVVADLAMQDFTDAYLFSTSGPVKDPALRGSMRIALGYEHLAQLGPDFALSEFWGRIGYRIGGSYNQAPFAPAGSGGVTDVAASLGLAIPFTPESTIDMAATFGSRAPATANASPSDAYFRFVLGVSLAERWFVPSRPRD